MALLARLTEVEPDWEPQWLRVRVDWLSRQAIQREPENGATWWARAVFLRHSGQRAEAIAVLEKWTPKYPNVYCWLTYAEMLEEAGRLAEAAKALDGAVALVEVTPNWGEGGKQWVRDLRDQFQQRHPTARGRNGPP